MKSRLPSIQTLEAFLHIAAGNNVVMVAEELNLTPSAISRRLQKLQESLGVRLIDRVGPRLALTPAGTLYAARLKPIVAALYQAGELVQPRPEDIRLRILAGPSLYANLIAPRLGGFLENWPGADIELMTSESVDGIQPDIRIRSSSGATLRPGEDRLLDFEVTPFCRPELLTRHAIETPADLLRVPLVEHIRSGTAWARLFAAAGIADHRGARRLIVDSSFMLYESAINGAGVAPLPRIYMSFHNTRGLVAPFPDMTTYMGASFIAPLGPNPRAIVRAFREWIIGEIQQDAKG